MKKPLAAALLASALVVPATGSSAGAAPAASTVQAADKFTAAIQKRLIGHSVEGRSIWAWRLGNPKSKKKVLLLAAMHGNETGAVHTLRALRDGRPISGADIWVVPVVNPDGVARRTRQNARKVDLNRNFSTKWKKAGGAVNSGRKAFSEPESRAVRDFADKIKPEYTVSFHQPLNGIDIRDTGNNKWSQRLAAQIQLPKKAFDCFSTCHGTYSMWFRKHHPSGAVITVEMTKHPSDKYLTRVAPRAILRSINATR